MLFLRVENEVEYIPAIDFICTLGESTSRGDEDKIGQFGSGFIHTLALFARKGILHLCKLCMGLEVYTPFIKKEKKKDSFGKEREISRICFKKQAGGTFDLNVSTGFGELDWHDVTMGVREIVSNAIDNAIPGTFVKQIVNSNQCGAKNGKIRFYIPMIPEISDYVDMLDRYFICIRPNYKKDVKVLPKFSRDNVKIYRKGVLVSNFNENSLFDYNILVKVDESRIVDKGEAREACANALIQDGRIDQISTFLSEVVIGVEANKNLWESRFDSYDTSIRYASQEIKDKYRQAAEKALAGRIPCRNSISAMMIQSKNLEPAILKDGYYDQFKCAGIKMDSEYLSDIEALGNTVIPANQNVIDTLNDVWDKLVALNLTNGRDKPPVSCFNSAVNGSAKTLGYCTAQFDKIYIHQDISNDNGNQLYSVMLEEVGHYITRASDCTRDFQTFFIGLAARLMQQ